MIMENKDKIILHLYCSKLASDSQVYSEHGYDVRKIGLDWGLDVMTYEPPENVYGIIANPPCTMFSLARTNAKTPRDFKEGMKLVECCLQIIWKCQYSIEQDSRSSKVSFWYIENPGSGFLKYFLGNPTFIYQPYEFGENYSKSTALWGYFNLPKKPLLFNPVPCGTSIGKKNTPFRGKRNNMTEKSKCPYSFAKAFFEANQ